MKTLLLTLLLISPVIAQESKPPSQSQLRLHLEDFPGLTRYAADNAKLSPMQRGRVIFFGDSITDAWESNGGSFFPSKSYLNRGISGQTTSQMLLRFRQDVIDLHPEAVVILAGINDIAGNTGITPLEVTEQNLQSMAELAHANHIKVILASVLPAFDFPWHKGLEPAPKVIALNKWLQQYCAQNHVTYLDYYTPMAAANGGMREGLSKDGVHPNTAGYAIMQPLAEAAIAKTLKH